jgi:hypothetical protein
MFNYNSNISNKLKIRELLSKPTKIGSLTPKNKTNTFDNLNHVDVIPKLYEKSRKSTILKNSEIFNHSSITTEASESDIIDSYKTVYSENKFNYKNFDECINNNNKDHLEFKKSLASKEKELKQKNEVIDLLNFQLNTFENSFKNDYILEINKLKESKLELEKNMNVYIYDIKDLKFNIEEKTSEIMRLNN